ncbi:MAG: thiol:disulfide interchange protein DsbA/DsbL [Pseudomonadota bacterium]
MTKRALSLISVFATLLVSQAALAQLRWVEGTHYTAITPPTSYEAPPGKIEVTEVFSYGCPACNGALPGMAKLKNQLPSDVVMNYLHAAFIPTEAWPMFQQAYITAKALGIAESTHEMMFTAIWKTGEIPLADPATGRIKQPLPTIEDAARFYSRHTAVKEAQFLEMAKSFGVATQIKRADELVKLWKIPSTPSLVVNGRYLVNMQAAGTWDNVFELVMFLVSQERVRLKMPTPAAKPAAAAATKPAAAPATAPKPAAKK